MRVTEEDPGDLETSPLLLRRASGDSSPSSSSSSGYFERDPAGITAGIKIKKLRKVRCGVMFVSLPLTNIMIKTVGLYIV